MDLATTLSANGVQWSIDVATNEELSRREGGKPYVVRRLRVRLVDLMSEHDGSTPAQPAALEAHYSMSARLHSENGIDHLLALALRDLLPDHPLRKAFLEDYGGGEVSLAPECYEGKGDCLGEAIHTAMRKYMHSDQSVILYNAQQQLLGDDWSHLLELIREEVRAVEKRAAGRNQPLRMRDVGMAMKRAMVERGSEVESRGATEANRYRRPERTEAQRFALIAFCTACKLTEDSEWMWGWAYATCNREKKASPAP